MLDIKFVRENPEIVKQNIKNKFQEKKLPLVDEVIALDAEYRKTIQTAEELRANRNKFSKQIGALMGQGKREEAEEMKKLVSQQGEALAKAEKKETELSEKIRSIMLTLPNIIDPSVPLGPDDSYNVEVQRFVSPKCRTIRFPITRILWRALTESILTAQDVLQVTDSII